MSAFRSVGRWLSTGLIVGSAGTAGCAQYLQKPALPQDQWSNPALKPPGGAKVAIVEFDDMQCPMCAAWNPELMQAAAKYKVPWVRHDFLIPGHPLSPQEAVLARWFDAKSAQLGGAFRDRVFAQQAQIATAEDLQNCTEQFAHEHGVQMPFAVDPQGTLMDAVRADCRLARDLGAKHTPTVWVVTQGSHEAGYRMVEVNDIHMLYVYLDQAVSATKEQAQGRHRS